MQETATPICPHCGSTDVIFKAKKGEWECNDCEERFAPQADHTNYLDTKTGKPKAIFFSYGHDDNKELVDRFKADLEKRGHKVWIDYKEIGTWNDWRGRITQGIHESEIALAFLSQHATRDPGVCRNEVAMALNRFGTLYPVLLEPVQNVTPPVTISHLQWQDLSQWREIRDGKIAGKEWGRWYEEKLIQIITLMEGEASEFEGDANGLRTVLEPAKFTSDIAYQIPDFTGREWVFDAYEDWLNNRPQSRLFWIKAGPGVGKTAIAAMLAHTRQSAVVSAWFCQAYSIERRDPIKALCSIAFQLAMRWDDYRSKLRFQLGFHASTRPEDLKELRETLLKKNEADLFNSLFSEPLNGLIPREHRLVVIIDALDEATDAHGQNPLVDLLVTRLSKLPSWLNFVVTSRPNPEVVAKLQGFAPFELDTEDKRNREDLAVYLQNGLVKRTDYLNLQEAEQTCIKTLLLDNSQGMILYLQQILNGLEEGAINLNHIDQIPRGLGSLYRIAFDHAYGGERMQTVFDVEVKPLLRLLLAAPEPLPPLLAQQILGWDKETYLRRRNLLGSYVIDSPQGIKLFHKTLYEWLGDDNSAPYYLDAEPSKKAIAEHLWKCFENTEDKFKLEWPHQTQYWLPYLISLLPQGEEGEALNKLGSYMHTFSLYDKAEELVRLSLESNEKVHGLESSNVASSLNSLGLLLLDKSNYINAETLLNRALTIREKVLEPEHPDLATSLCNMALLLNKKGDDKGAEPLYRRALVILERVYGFDHPKVAHALNNLAVLLQDKHDIAVAEPLHRRALAIRERILGPEHPDVAQSLCNLASLSNLKEDYAGAEPLYRQALAIREKVFGPDHPGVALILNNLGTLLKEKGDFAGAELLHKRALAIREKVFGLESEYVAGSLTNLANLLFSKSDYVGAEPLFTRALEIKEKVFGIDSKYVENSLTNLADLLCRKSDYAGAEPLITRALAIREKVFGTTHPSTLRACDRLAWVMVRTNRRQKAIELLKHYLEVTNADEDSIKSLRYNLACYECLEGNLDEAKRLIKEQLILHPDQKATALEDKDFDTIKDFIENISIA